MIHIDLENCTSKSTVVNASDKTEMSNAKWTRTFLEREENQNVERKTESYIFRGLCNGIYCGWEQRSTSGRFATGWLWLCAWEISSVGKDQVNNREFCILKITPIVCFCSVSMHFFILSLSTNALYDFHSGIIYPFIFIR